MSTIDDAYDRPLWNPLPLFLPEEEDELLDINYLDTQFKAAALKTCPCVVGVLTLGVPDGMFKRRPRMMVPTGKWTENLVCKGSGTVIECEEVGGGKFSTTIITTSNLFMRTNGDPPSNIKVEVFLANGKVYNGHVLACDFHYNLAVVNTQLDTPVKPVNLRDLDDIISLHQHQTSNASHSFQLRRHSNLIKIRPGDMVAALGRCTSTNVSVAFGQFSANYPESNCTELYSFDCKDRATLKDIYGGPVIDCHGEVIGIVAVENYFLPCNIVSRWWNYYKQCKKLCRPWLGVKVANLHAVKLHFLEKLVQKFPTVSSGVVVTEVVENSVASVLRKGDVIVQCNGATVRSILDFFDKMWDKLGSSVELSLLRGADHVILNSIVNEPAHDNLYRWPFPYCEPRPKFDSEMPESSAEMSESSDEMSEADEMIESLQF